MFTFTPRIIFARNFVIDGSLELGCCGLWGWISICTARVGPLTPLPTTGAYYPAANTVTNAWPARDPHTILGNKAPIGGLLPATLVTPSVLNNTPDLNFYVRQRRRSRATTNSEKLPFNWREAVPAPLLARWEPFLLLGVAVV